MKSINQLDKELKLLCDAHQMVNNYIFEDFVIAYQKDKITHTSVVAMVYNSSLIYANANASDNVVLTLTVCDKIYEDGRNVADVRSDCYRVLKNIADVIATSTRWTSWVKVLGATPANYFRYGTADIVDGWKMDITLQLNVGYDLCAIPLNDYDLEVDLSPSCAPVAIIIDGEFSENAPSGSTVYITTGAFSCDQVAACPLIQEMQLDIEENANAIAAETTARQNADTTLQENIDAIDLESVLTNDGSTGDKPIKAPDAQSVLNLLTGGVFDWSSDAGSYLKSWINGGLTAMTLGFGNDQLIINDTKGELKHALELSLHANNTVSLYTNNGGVLVSESVTALARYIQIKLAATEVKHDILINLNAPSVKKNGAEIATEDYVNAFIDTTIKVLEGYDPTATSLYPVTYNGNPIQKGDSFKFTVAGTVNGIAVKVGDFAISMVDLPGQVDANWQIGQTNVDQATESVQGIAKIATQAIIENELTTNDTDIVTAKKFWFGIARMIALPWTWAEKQIFTLAPRFNSVSASQYLKVDSNKDVESVAAIPAADVTESSTKKFVPQAVADSDFLVGQASDNSWIKKTLAQTKTILGLSFGTTAGTYAQGNDSRFPSQSAWSTHSSTITGFSGTPTQDIAYMTIGKTMYVRVLITGTSNATTFTFTIPSNAKVVQYFRGQGTSNGTKLDGTCATRAASNVVDVYSNPNESAFNASGTKALNITMIIELA